MGCSKKDEKLKNIEISDNVQIKLSSVSETRKIKKKQDLAYKFKQQGQNGLALKQFEQIINMVPEKSSAYASVLDDKASVLLRTGRTEEAKKLYTEAINILKKLDAEPLLLKGIEGRLDILNQMVKSGIRCNEPLVPPVDGKIPYFPSVEKMQNALNELTLEIAKCKNSNTLEPITMRVIISGDGKFIKAFAKGKFEGTKTESCVVNKLKELLPGADLPPFSACFRGFTYPFMIGNHPDKS
jgi:tetratricopeptide (TPR) repeat protein